MSRDDHTVTLLWNLRLKVNRYGEIFHLFISDSISPSSLTFLCLWILVQCILIEFYERLRLSFTKIVNFFRRKPSKSTHIDSFNPSEPSKILRLFPYKTTGKSKENRSYLYSRWKINDSWPNFAKEVIRSELTTHSLIYDDRDKMTPSFSNSFNWFQCLDCLPVSFLTWM